MNAAVLRATGAEAELAIEEIDTPVPQPGQALVRLRAAALNRRDQWIRRGQYAAIRLPAVPGSDGCGVVESTGSPADAALVGRRVVINPNIGWGHDERVQSPSYTILGMPSQGTLAEYVCVATDRLAEAPDHLSDAECAALPLAGLTAWRAVMVHGLCHEASHVLVTGIGGGVATMAALFAKAAGAAVVVSSSSNDKLLRAREVLGVQGVNYREEGWLKKAKELCGGLDLVVNSAGGEQFAQFPAAVQPGGRIVFYGATNGVPSTLDLHRLFWKQITIQGSTMGSDADFRAMMHAVSTKQLRPLVHHTTYALHQVNSALDAMEGGEQLGKIIITL